MGNTAASPDAQIPRFTREGKYKELEEIIVRLRNETASSPAANQIDINQRDSETSRTGLMYASELGRNDLVTLLLTANGIDINAMEKVS